MKRVLPALCAVGALAIALPAAAQSWLPINARQATLDARIDLGVRTGSLTQSEAARLRAQYRDIASLEARYRANGLQEWERKDLDARFDRLGASIRIQNADNQRAGGNAPWQSINMRQAVLDKRIDQGVRVGSLTRTEAANLRTQFRDVANLEARYRATQGGLQDWERRDLDARFDRLSASIRLETADNQKAGGPRWQSIDMRQAALDQRIDVGVRNGTLSRAEATRLRTEFRQIAAIEQRYRANGLQPWERAELDKRFDQLSAQIRVERADRDNRYDRGYGANAGYRR